MKPIGNDDHLENKKPTFIDKLFFSGDLKGRSCALLSIFYIGWTMIGYCGAHNKKFSFLLIYSALVVLYVFTNIIVFGALAPKFQWLDPNLVWIMCGYVSILMICALLLAYKIRIKEESIQTPYDYGSYYGASSALPRNSSFRRMNSLRSGYSKNWNRLFGVNNPTPGTTGLVSAGAEFGPVYTQQQQPSTTIGPTLATRQQSLPPTMQPPLPPPLLTATQIGPPSYQGYHTSTAAMLPPPPSLYQMSSAVSMNPAVAYGSNYFTRNWQRMSSKRNGVLRTNSAAYGSAMNGNRYNACELKNLGPGRVNFF